MTIHKLLIANRGEIAIRIARAADDLGIATVGVAPRDDAACLHLRRVDHTVTLEGRGPAAYLDIAQMVRVAVEEGCDAVHPGYGFLSESAAFASACEAAGVVFVGPRPETLATFGDKVRAREAAGRLDVPLPEGSAAGITLDGARAFMASLGEGAAVMVKSVAGGGGRGMRVVRSPDALEAAYAVCRSEARASFGRDEVYLERYIATARHVEVQVIGDGRGPVAHLFDRECSLQRRHQKLIEIAPCPALPMALRRRMIDAALTMARAADYRSLGTFEFLVDADAPGGGAFYFMEVNPRLQVEHTVTEEVTGVDLVAAQLRIAGGASLADIGFDPAHEVTVRGYAIQARINVERMNPDGSATPSGGTLTALDLPTGPGVRVDTLGYTGYATSPSYDSLLAKVIAVSAAPDFAAAVARLRRALDETRIAGVDTNLGFLRALAAHPAMDDVAFHTQFVEAAMPALLSAVPECGRHVADTPAGEDAASAGRGRRAAPAGHIEVASPMPGAVTEVLVAVGDMVSAGQQLAIVEAMKMQTAVAAPVAGRVSGLEIAVGDILELAEPLVFIDPAEGADAGVAVEAEVDLDAIRPELRDVLDRHAGLLDDARPEAVAKRRKIGKRSIRENLAELFDETRYDEYGSLMFAAQRTRRSIEELIRVSPADGMLAAVGSVNADLFGPEKSRCLALAHDYSVFAGTQGFNAQTKKDRMLSLAAKWETPVLVWAEGGGGRPGDTDYAHLSGLSSLSFRRLASLNGKVPIVGVVTGRCFAGNAAMAGCCDVIIATPDASIGMAGPAMIEGGGLGIVTPDEVGPVRVQAANGVVDLVVADEADAVRQARRYLSYFQGDLETYEAADQRRLRHAVPQDRRRAYDLRALLEVLADRGSVMELRRDFGTPLITALVRIEGKAIGVIGNDCRSLGGAIDADASDKAARFMQLCDAFGLPILSLCDTPGFMVGPEAEKTALVRHTSRMFVTGAGLTVPMVMVILRKAYGLGAMAMAGGGMHATDATFAWPTGEISSMGVEGAVRLAYRAELAAAAEGAERDALFERKTAEIYESGKALNVASTMDIDDVIDPVDTRRRIMGTLRAAGPIGPARGTRKIDTW
ncbi:carboxyl transferase domain-containing protein [Acuticoccus sp. I52.16.1]|uniref:acetyl-CoA carboxylase family protein n=1 Tax=Acuticoccus sp. I52.16.1 TaxID=2928472 RepID=UPI001FD0898D|nr:carboxyl transferase domain-containing protein [Acuticoccus sp. I52.16.1]UOM37250.1 biotin/lipoyl-binding protein [Acuticoccus sp. I52.16.1]